jgi:hypothetical protein
LLKGTTYISAEPRQIIELLENFFTSAVMKSVISRSLRRFIEVIGQIAVLGAAFSYACAAIYGRRFKGLSPLVVAKAGLQYW